MSGLYRGIYLPEITRYMPEHIGNCRIVSVADTAIKTASVRSLDPAKPYRASVWQPDRNPLVWPDQEDIRDGAIAFHPIYGFVTWSSWWRFSTEAFIEDLKSAENNPAIVAHLIRIDSGGGEVFGCHEAFEAVRDLSKPCVAVVDSICASAAYWLACAADRIYTTSMFSETGSIGVMGVLTSDRKWMEKNGFEEIELYSTLSGLKNKITRDAVDGHPEEYIRKMLDPIAEQFIADVKSARGIDDGSDALKGAMYYAAEALPAGLIDGQMPFEDTVGMLMDMVPEKNDGLTPQEIDINHLNINL